jgi:hypothetical protein
MSKALDDRVMLLGSFVMVTVFMIAMWTGVL